MINIPFIYDSNSHGKPGGYNISFGLGGLSSIPDVAKSSACSVCACKISGSESPVVNC